MGARWNGAGTAGIISVIVSSASRPLPVVNRLPEGRDEQIFQTNNKDSLFKKNAEGERFLKTQQGKLRNKAPYYKGFEACLPDDLSLKVTFKNRRKKVKEKHSQEDLMSESLTSFSLW